MIVVKTATMTNRNIIYYFPLRLSCFLPLHLPSSFTPSHPPPVPLFTGLSQQMSPGRRVGVPEAVMDQVENQTTKAGVGNPYLV